MSDKQYGPSLPPGFQQPSEEDEKSPDYTRRQHIGPELPDHLKPKVEKSELPQLVGPQLPEHLRKKLEAIYDDEDDDDTAGVIGPRIPKSMRNPLDVSLEDPEDEESSSSSDGEVIGPMPPTAPCEYNVAARFEQRAQKMKERLLNEGKEDEGPKGREEWMTQLPEDVGKKIAGVGPARGFSRKKEVGEYDREGWTATPGKSRQPSVTPKTAASMAQQARDQQQEEILRSYNSTKKSSGTKSLMELHQDKLKKKKLEEGSEDKPAKRQQFDREKELAMHHYDPANTRRTIQNSRELGSKFSSGSQKFL